MTTVLKFRPKPVDPGPIADPTSRTGPLQAGSDPIDSPDLLGEHRRMRLRLLLPVASLVRSVQVQGLLATYRMGLSTLTYSEIPRERPGFALDNGILVRAVPWGRGFCYRRQGVSVLVR